MLELTPENRRLEVLDNEKSFRLYNCAKHASDDPVLLPSVTTILSKTKDKKDERFLDNWVRNNKQKSEMYLNDGTLMHLVYEHINSKRFNLPFRGCLSDIPDMNDMTLRQRRLIFNFRELNETIVNLERQESFTYFSDGNIGWVGTYDGIGSVRIGDKIHRCVIDFKTSENPKIEKYVYDYKLQLLAYIVAENHKKESEMIRDGVIMISVNSDEITNQIFHINNDMLVSLYPKWISRVYEFNRKYKHIIEKGYDQLSRKVK